VGEKCDLRPTPPDDKIILDAFGLEPLQRGEALRDGRRHAALVARGALDGGERDEFVEDPSFLGGG
jgi:hypothetical protein